MAFLLLSIWLAIHATVIASSCSTCLCLQSRMLRDLPTGPEIDAAMGELGLTDCTTVEPLTNLRPRPPAGSRTSRPSAATAPEDDAADALCFAMSPTNRVTDLNVTSPASSPFGAGGRSEQRDHRSRA